MLVGTFLLPVPKPPSFAQISAAVGEARYFMNASIAGVSRNVMIRSPPVSTAFAFAPGVIDGNGTTLKSVCAFAFVACRISRLTKSPWRLNAAFGGVDFTPHKALTFSDIKQLSAGTRLFLPVDTPGALFSAGDAHFAQGDSETCGTAIEMTATLRVRFTVHSGAARERGINDPEFTRSEYWVAPEYAAPRRFYATTGMSIDGDGVLHSENATLAARNALLNMISHLGRRGFNRQQAYAICSVAVDLKISQLVDVPSFLVSAFLPEDIFTTP